MNDKAPLLTQSELSLLDQALGFYCEDGISEDQEEQQEVRQLRDKIAAAQS